MLQEKQQKDLLCLLSNLTLLLLSANWHNWGSHCLQCCKFSFQVIAGLVLLAVLSCTSMPQALQLCYWGAGSALALQAKHSWGGETTWYVWNCLSAERCHHEDSLLGWFFSFQWVGVESCTGSLWLLGHHSRSFHEKELLLVKEGLSGWMWNIR